MTNPPLIAVLGPTASGKSGLALRLARRFRGEIVGCDSVQVYRFLDIGTSKVLKPQQAGIPHHLIDFLNPDQEFTAGQYMALGRRVLSEIGQRGNLPLVTGGTGLYLRALLDGLFDGPSRCESLRGRLRQQARRKGDTHLHRLLARVDPDSARRISPRDQPKIIRALEVFFLTAKPISLHFRADTEKLQGFRLLKIGLDPPRDPLYRRIEERVDRMFAGGLVEEVRSILARGYSADCKPLQSLGYLQVVRFLKGEKSLQAAVDATKQATRNYAKRQLTWFRKEEKVIRFPGFGDEDSLGSAVEAYAGDFVQAGSRRPSGTLTHPVLSSSL
ncbi:MAG: tRNA (adenosine(37)-N6)-dimethylallyltransferase MiaA [Acidobacteria bacterium]|nr:tRNA (adenosine(37)-N6)-dimethylallyltransferase MiaA [Acidobacteriota bacterium]